MRNFSKIKRVIIKVGSSSLVNEDLSINMNQIRTIMKSFFMLREKGIDVALVTSGAIAIGMHELGLNSRPKEMAIKQACAAVGQAKLMEAYNYCASALGIICGQILINHDDFQIRKRMLYLTNTLDEMFNNHIIPIINENDALAVEEIKVGDNDTLSSLIAPMIHADLLVLFSDIDGLFDKNPKEYDDAKLIPTVNKVTNEIYKMAGTSSSTVGTGGMKTKLNAAKIATTAGTNMIICNSNRIDDLYDIALGNEIGTLFKAIDKKFKNRDHWIINNAYPMGTIVCDAGLINALSEKKVSILPKGVKDVKGTFLSESVIAFSNEDGKVIGKGITNFTSDEIKMICGKQSSEIEAIIGKKVKPEIIHANNLVLLSE